MSGMHKKRVLFIAEGEKTERELILSSMHAFGIEKEEYAILLYRTNIHALIDVIVGENDEYIDDLAEIEIKEVLASMLDNGKGNLCEIDYHGVHDNLMTDAEWLRTASITDVFLLFDFDPHAFKYRPDRLHAFQEVYTDSTNDLGKLLLSYPMVEAYREAAAHSFEEFCGINAYPPFSSFKRVVHERLHNKSLGEFCEIDNYDRDHFARCISYSVAKAHFLTTDKNCSECLDDVLTSDLSMKCDELDLLLLLEAQQQLYERERQVSVVSTAPLFLSIWPMPLNHAFYHCKSINLA